MSGRARRHAGRVATVAWGKDEIEYRVDVRQRASGLACSRRETPEIASIQSLSNTSVILDWQVVIIINHHVIIIINDDSSFLLEFGGNGNLISNIAIWAKFR